ncbi:hypothetical protein COU56_01280 [Candidatus Pacearchaeota archaeon CG10_big_fil_rev_8_21_14_0_10_31_9]|nr:MAG: hypothetical protein COU56_01280 [Candidatus Pacearchaeota archaeon CG10_big_fil_rev_8_21_14_0_10_31_9]
MPKLPQISGKELVRILNKIGYEVDHQSGSHIILRQNFSPFRRITVPNHPNIAKGTLLAIIKESGLSRDEFFELQ